MRICFISTAVFPSASANRIHMISMADAFTSQGAQMDFLCKSCNQETVVKYPKIRFLELATNSSLVSAWKFIKFINKNEYDFWYVREPHLTFWCILLRFLSLRKKPTIVYEVHDMPRDFLDSMPVRFLKRFGQNFLLITITDSLKNDLCSKYNFPLNRTVVLRDGVDLTSFNNSLSKYDARKLIGYTNAKPLVMYTGHLYPWKGVYTLADAAQKMPDVNFWFVGGHEKDILEFKSKVIGCENITVIGYVEHKEIKNYTAAADVLVLPNSRMTRMSERYTSPLKLFEYMASKRPIVASNLPSIREVLDYESAYFFESDNHDSLFKVLEKALNDPHGYLKTNKAAADVEEYDWKYRVVRIIKLLKQHNEKMAN